MEFRVRGNLKELRRWQTQLKKTPDALVTVNEQLAEETISLIREGFEDSTDPYGHEWESLALRDGRPLEDTGRLKSSWFRANVSRTGYTVANATEYAIYHQIGTGIFGPRGKPIVAKGEGLLRIPVRGGPAIYTRSVRGSPARKMVPDNGELPPRWQARLVETAEDTLTELFR
jgi:phage gpG-like protein